MHGRHVVLGALASFAGCHLVNGVDDFTFDGAGGNAVGGQGGAGTHAVSVAISGLSTELTVELNGEQVVVADADGSYTFDAELTTGASYAVTFADPIGEACSADMASGEVQDADVVVSIGCTPTVRPLHAAAPDWLDYLDAAGTAPCDAATVTRYAECIHGGERRAVYVPGATDCVGVTGRDTLDAFLWSCDESGPHVQLVSDGLRNGLGLTELIDFSGQAFVANAVEISSPASTVTTEPAIWWSNAFAVADETTTHDEAGTIYLVLADPMQGLTVDGDRVALVVAPSALVTPTIGPSLTASATDFVWLEGPLGSGVSVDGTAMAVLRNMRVEGEVELAATRATRVHDVEISQGNVCFDASDNTGLAVEVVAVSRCMLPLRFANGIGGYARDIIASESQQALLIVGAAGFAVDNLMLSNFENAALNVMGSTGVHLTRVTAAASEVDGVRFDCTDCSLRGATAVLAPERGFELGGTNVFIADLLAVGNGVGIHAEDLTAAGRNWIAVSQRHATTSINLEVVNSALTLAGVMKLGAADTNCVVSASTGIDAGCAAVVPSTFVLSAGNANNMFAEKVTQEEMVNASDSAGAAQYAADLDWVHFESDVRGWGRDGSMFPNVDHQGRCSPSSTSCRIWDWSLRTVNTVAKAQNAIPTGDNTATVDGQMFLLSAVEILGDHVGDDDNLCESNERCGYTPNVGGYQGHGGFVPIPFREGAVSGVLLFRYAQNGK